MTTYDLRGLLAEVWATPGVSTIVYAILLNTMLAIAVAVRSNTFTLARVGDFITQQVIPYVTAYAGAQFLGEGAGYSWIGTAAYAAVMAKIGSSILEKLELLGVPVPQQLMQYIRKEPLMRLTGEVKEFRLNDAREVPDALRSTSGDTSPKG